MWITPDFSPGKDIILTISPGGASLKLGLRFSAARAPISYDAPMH